MQLITVSPTFQTWSPPLSGSPAMEVYVAHAWLTQWLPHVKPWTDLVGLLITTALLAPIMHLFVHPSFLVSALLSSLFTKINCWRFLPWILLLHLVRNLLTWSADFGPLYIASTSPYGLCAVALSYRLAFDLVRFVWRRFLFPPRWQQDEYLDEDFFSYLSIPGSFHSKPVPLDYEPWFIPLDTVRPFFNTPYLIPSVIQTAPLPVIPLRYTQNVAPMPNEVSFRHSWGYSNASSAPVYPVAPSLILPASGVNQAIAWIMSSTTPAESLLPLQQSKPIPAPHGDYRVRASLATYLKKKKLQHVQTVVREGARERMTDVWERPEIWETVHPMDVDVPALDTRVPIEVSFFPMNADLI